MIPSWWTRLQGRIEATLAAPKVEEGTVQRVWEELLSLKHSRQIPQEGYFTLCEKAWQWTQTIPCKHPERFMCIFMEIAYTTKHLPVVTQVFNEAIEQPWMDGSIYATWLELWSKQNSAAFAEQVILQMQQSSSPWRIQICRKCLQAPELPVEYKTAVIEALFSNASVKSEDKKHVFIDYLEGLGKDSTQTIEKRKALAYRLIQPLLAKEEDPQYWKALIAGASTKWRASS